MGRAHRIPHRQLLGWIYVGFGVVETSFVAGILIDVRENLRRGVPVPDDILWALVIVFLLLPSLLFYFLAAHKLLAKKGAMRPLTIASSILTVFNGLVLVPLMWREVPRYAPLSLVALGIYGIVVAVRAWE